MNLNAFESRFETIFSHMSRSTEIGSESAGQSTEQRQPGSLDGGAKAARELGREPSRVGRLVNRLDAPGLDA